MNIKESASIFFLFPEILVSQPHSSSNIQRRKSTTKHFIFEGKGAQRYLIIANSLNQLCQYQSGVLISKTASSSMENIPKLITGGCLCGGVRYEINFSPEHDWKHGVYSLPCNRFFLRNVSTNYYCSLTHANALSAVRIVAAWCTTSIQ